MLRLKTILLIAYLTLVSGTGLGSISLSEKTKSLGLTLVNSVEIRKTQKSELEKTQEDFKKRADETNKSISRSLNKIALDMEEVQSALKKASDHETEYLNKKLTLLNDRKQNLLDHQELWKEAADYLESNAKLLAEIVNFLQSPSPDLKPAYSWKEFREAQLRLAEYSAKIDNDKVKKDNIKRQKAAVSDHLNSLEKQHAVKVKEREKLMSHVDKSDKTARYDSATFKAQADILDQELHALQENIEHVKLQNEILQLESHLVNDLIEFEQYKFSEHKALVAQIENRLVLDYNDVDIARSTWKNEVHNALALKEKLNAARDAKKTEKEKLGVEIDFLREKREKAKAKGIPDRIEYLLDGIQLRQMRAAAYALDKELQLLDAKKELADMLANEKELQYNMVELRYRLKTETENFEELLMTFHNKKDIAVSLLNSLKDKLTNAITSQIETNRALDKNKLDREKMGRRRTTTFKGRDAQFTQAMGLYAKIKTALTQTLEQTQAYLAVIADLVTHQEKIVNQYQLILSELEARQRTYSIWKRSSKAISFDGLLHSGLEAEAFFKKLYWETPAHLRPSTLWHFIRSLSWFDYFKLLCFLLFFFLSFVSIRSLLLILKQRGSALLARYQGHARYQYIHLGVAIIDFMLEHYGLLFTWFFVFLHIIFKFSYIFSTLQPFASPYTIAIFFLGSIPLLVYLSNSFVQTLKDLNTKLSYLFFAEKFQNRFILLISIFCYASAVLLPLRLALLHYIGMQYSEFAIVLLGAYSLILLIIMALLFSKEDILKFVPSSSTFWIWIKRKTDKHYYPVFFFIMGLLILSSPYVGYSNMAWFLAFAVPCSGFLGYLLFSMHSYLRTYAVFLFMKEEDDEFIDKFEHAKAYYGFFVIFSFILLLFVTFLLVSRIWGLDYSPYDIWQALSERWVIRLGVDNKLGFIEIMKLGAFVAIGFLVSSLLHRFILNRLFDILRSEPGTQNTISRIVHYTTIFIATVLGMNAIQMSQFIFWIGAPFAAAVVLASKDIVSDLLAGFFVLIERPIEIGNYVQVDEIHGTVHKIDARSTTIITSKNHSVIIPNKDLVTKWIINWGHGRFAVGFELGVRVEHSADPEFVRKLLLTVVSGNQFILKVPAVVARLEDLEPDSLYFLVRAFISARRVKEQWEIAAMLRTEIIKAFREHNIVLAKPSRMLEFAQHDQPKSIEIKFDPAPPKATPG